MKAYVVQVEDRKTGKIYDLACAPDCEVVKSGWFGEVLTVPADTYDQFVADYDPLQSPAWRGMSEDFEQEYSDRYDSRWQVPIKSVMDFNGREAIDMASHLIGYSIMLFDDMRNANEEFDKQIEKIVGRKKPFTGYEVMVRYLACRSLELGPITTPPGVNYGKLSSTLEKVVTLYGTLAMFSISSTGDTWDSIKTFGGFIHQMASGINHAFRRASEDYEDNSEMAKNLFVKVSRVVCSLPTGKPSNLYWQNFQDHIDESKEESQSRLPEILEEIMREIANADDDEEDKKDEVDEEVFGHEDDDFWDNLSKK